ncbi:MAG: peptide ABC transporter substrate-binding protein [Anaerolineae bacterium]|nr:peptide ABC transporter substrate-binding protein [Anaerolineae bacterium]
MFKKSLRALPVLAVMMAMVVALVPTGFAFASSTDITLVSLMQEGEPITYYNTNTAQISTIDPQAATDSESIDAIEQLFLALTDADPENPGNIVAEMATEWSTSEDGLTWTFTIRDDVPWVRWDPVTDEGEVLRMVTAYDFEYGIKRACDPRLGSLYGAVVAAVLDGCEVLNTMDVADVSDEDYDLVNVTALDDTTVQVGLQFPAGFFFSMTPMWILRAVPQEIIQEYGDDWTELGTIAVNGPFVLDEWVRGVRVVFVKNPYMPDDLRGPGNVERMITTIVQDAGTTFALYQDDQVDISGVPAAEVQSVLEDEAYQDQLLQTTNLATYYFAFLHDKPPFDDVHVRRAFSASVDREAFVQEALQGRGVPMIHLIPPGMFGAVPINEVGVGYNPEYAKEQMDMGPYPNCEGFPPIEVVTYQNRGDWAEIVAASVEEVLGCPTNLFTIEQLEFSVLLEVTNKRTPSEDRPHMWTLGWGPDYPDAHNWVFDAGLLSCEGENNLMRPCTEIDDLIMQAKVESDPEVRKELYYRVEELAFGPEGEHSIMPLFMGIGYSLVKPWLSGPLETDGLFGGAHYDWRSIDQEAQLAAREG